MGMEGGLYHRASWKLNWIRWQRSNYVKAVRCTQHSNVQIYLLLWISQAFGGAAPWGSGFHLAHKWEEQLLSKLNVAKMWRKKCDVVILWEKKKKEKIWIWGKTIQLWQKNEPLGGSTGILTSFSSLVMLSFCTSLSSRPLSIWGVGIFLQPA